MGTHKFYLLIIISLITLSFVLLNPHQTMAACNTQTDPNCVIGTINPPPQIANLVSKGGAGGISFFLSLVVQLLYTISALAVLFMVLFGAFQFITSGGEKDAVSKARGRITYAIIGMVLLAVAFLLLRILGQVLHFQFFDGALL